MQKLYSSKPHLEADLGIFTNWKEAAAEAEADREGIVFYEFVVDMKGLVIADDEKKDGEDIIAYPYEFGHFAGDLWIFSSSLSRERLKLNRSLCVDCCNHCQGARGKKWEDGFEECQECGGLGFNSDSEFCQLD